MKDRKEKNDKLNSNKWLTENFNPFQTIPFSNKKKSTRNFEKKKYLIKKEIFEEQEVPSVGLYAVINLELFAHFGPVTGHDNAGYCRFR